MRMLNRAICWRKDCITYEVDIRHAEVVIDQFQVSDAKVVTSPGTREEQSKANETTSPPLSPEGASKYRMISARPRKSTSGGVHNTGPHVTNIWTST